MGAQDITVGLVLDLQDGDRDARGDGYGGGDPEFVEEELQYLVAELDQLDVTGIGRVPSGPAPDGTRGEGAVEVGALLIGLGGGGALLPVLVGLVQDWLSRRRSGTIRLRIGEDEIELTATTDEMRQRALDDFLRRHSDPGPAAEPPAVRRGE
ncbi:effector-associated constant component EACC1 [Streptomyces geranii]|uniref:effector-associated constant component EACC1 n=1 Tax=Streptomyces geranii TaxID=2058923 RepID=UPI000D0328D3|nr:hypothetical protein [Streptomyces geranii]